jgi:cytochrome P450
VTNTVEQPSVGAPKVSFNPFEPGFTDDPYPHFAALRAGNPVEQHELGFWALWRYTDVYEVLRAKMSVQDDKVIHVGPMANVYEQVRAERGLDPVGTVSMLDLDPPDHTRLRKLVSKAFTPRTIDQLAPAVEQLVDDALDRIEEQGTADLISTLAFPLPFTVISLMLGMPDTDTDRLRELSGTIVRSLEPVPDEDTVRAIVDADIELVQLSQEAIAWKRKNPADDLLTALINAEDGGDVLSEDELRAQLMLLYIAGHETTVNLIGNGMLALLRAPDQLALWRDRPDLDENAIEELLRYDSPVQMSRRITLEDYAVGDQVIPAGSFVIASLASGNRDEAQFGADAGELRIDRENARQQISFGSGVHHCLGAALARLEGRVAMSRLIRRFPELQLADEPEWNGRVNLRGLAQLPVVVA